MLFDVYFNEKDHDKHFFLLMTSLTGATLEACPELC
jgi:hypothetical protein